MSRSETHVVLRHQDDVQMGATRELHDARAIAWTLIEDGAGAVFDIYAVSVPDGRWRWVEMVTAQDADRT